MQWLIRGVFALGMYFGLSAPAAAEAPPPEGPASEDPAASERIVIDFDVEGLPDTRAEIATTVDAELQRILSEQAELPPGVVVAEDRRLLIELRPGPIPGADDVLIRIEAQIDGRMIGESATETCLSCTNEQVAEKAFPMLEPLLAELPAPPKPKPEPAAEGEREQVVLPAPTLTPEGPKRPLLISGASLLGVGVAGVGAGVALILVNERVVSEPGDATIDTLNYRKPGVGVAVAGGVVAIGGAALLGLAFRDRARVGEAELAPTASLAPGSYSVGVVGRF